MKPLLRVRWAAFLSDGHRASGTTGERIERELRARDRIPPIRGIL